MKKILSLLLALTFCAGLSVPVLAASGFTDVEENSPFAPAIAWAVEKGVTKGTTPTTFGPGNTCTTSHILTFLWRAAGRPGDGGDERAAVTAWASGLGIDVSDLSAPCTRAAAVTDIWKAQGSPAAGKAASFTDVSPSAPYAGAVNWAVEEGVTNGTGGGAFSPEAVCTRGQIVTFLYRALTGGAEETAGKPETPAAGTGTLANGKPITEENVLEIIQELLKKYPSGMTWNDNTARPGTPSDVAYHITRQYTSAQYGMSASMKNACGGFASLVSDTIFGSGDANPARKVPLEQVRPGDVIIYLNADGKLLHLATAASRIYDTYEVGYEEKNYTYPVLHIYDGNHGGKVVYTDYGIAYSKSNPEYISGEYYEVWTRYPTDNTTPWTGDSSSGSSSGFGDTGGSQSTPSETPSTPTPSKGVPIWDTPCDFCGKISKNNVMNPAYTKHICNDCYQKDWKAAKAYLDS